MDKEELFNKITNSFIENEDLMAVVSEINSYDGYFEDMQWWENDEDFFETMFGDNVMEAVRAVCFGEYNFMDDYVRINAYGNLESSSFIQGELEDRLDDIINYLLENWDYFKDYISLTDETKDLINQYLGNSESEDDE